MCDALHVASIHLSSDVLEVVPAQETEGLELPRDVILRGVKILLEQPAKGHYYVIKARPRANSSARCLICCTVSMRGGVAAVRSMLPHEWCTFVQLGEHQQV
jgi:hypothetical protein